jgi:hypothetical protein
MKIRAMLVIAGCYTGETLPPTTTSWATVAGHRR